MTTAGYFDAERTIPSGVSVSATTNAGGPTAVTFTPATYESVTAMCAGMQADLISQRSVSGGTWSVTHSTTTGLVTIAVTNGSYSITWTSTEARDILGFTGNITSQTSVTAGDQARGFWMPDATPFVDGRWEDAPDSTDHRQMRSPNGFMIGHVGNVCFKQTNLRYSHVPQNRCWVADESVANESLQQFMRDTQWGQGHTWFTPSSKVIIMSYDGTELGGGDVAGWYLASTRSMGELATRAVGGWDGYWSVTFPEVVTDS